MKQLKTKVLLSAFVLLFALVATIGSTFAWFTVSDTANVESMIMNVNAEDSILIRMANADGSIKDVSGDNDLYDASQYKTTLTTADVLNYYAYDTFKLSPVTAIQDYDTPITAANVDPKLLNTMAIGTNYTRALVATDAGDKNAVDGKYIELHFYLYSQTAATVNIGVTGFDVASESTNSTSQAEIVDAIRLATWRAGVWQGDMLTGSVNYTTETDGFIFGESLDYDFAFTAGLPGYVAAPGAGEFNAIPGVDATALEALALHNSTSTIFTLSTEVPTLVTVRVFVEGWDAQTSNAVISAKFNIKFSFNIL